VSRSYKKNPYLKYNGRERSKKAKRTANKAVRRHIKKELDNVPEEGSWHRKLTESWDIYDVISYCPNAEDWLDENDWKKYYWRK
jgi:hypothetical protein